MRLARPEWLWSLGFLPIFAAVGCRGRAAEGAGLVGPGAGGASLVRALDILARGDGAVDPGTGGAALGDGGRAPLPAGHDVVLALDVSRSMAARDAVPDRLGAAIESAESLLKGIGREEGDRVAVVAFAGRACSVAR